MTGLSSPGPDADRLRADSGEPDHDRADLAERTPVKLDEDAIRKRAEQADPDEATDPLI